MTKEEWMRKIRKYKETILRGTLVAWDPSSGSKGRSSKTGSDPGYAVFKKKKLIKSGVIAIENPKEEIQWKLQQQYYVFRTLLEEHQPDVLVYEDPPAIRHMGRFKIPQGALVKSVGALLSWPGPTIYIPMEPLIWKKLVSDEYVKGDEEDAVEMGKIVIAIADKIVGGQRQKKV